jgi:lipoprotein-anchoring transpeptidase ErfK/SrfK
VNTLKSAAVVVVLLVVLYGVYVALNKPDFFSAPPPPADVAPPLVEFGPAESSSAPVHTVVPSQPGMGATNPADVSRTVPGGSFQPNLDTGDMPPPTSPPSTSVPADPTASADSELRRSNFESPAGSASTAPPLEEPAAQPQTPAAAAAAAAPALAAYSLKRDFQEAERLIGEGQFQAALARLSPHYDNVAAADRGQLIAWLDALAGKVIYSREHLLAAPHRVSKGETLYDVARLHNVPWPLLQNVNGLVGKDPLVLVQGTELKIVPGPFRAVVNLTTSEVTLFVNDLYAGRFPFTLGEHQPQPGTYQVQDKRNDHTYYGLDGRLFPSNDPANPYGGFWLSLGGETAIHGSPASPGPRPLGCISLSPQDAKDVYGILSKGSEVTIRR